MTVPEPFIAGHRVERRAVTCPLPEGGERILEVLCVAELDRLIDHERLLRDPDAPEPPYWTIVWIGARALAGRLLASPPPRTAHILDLGCGLGLSGVAAGLSGASVCFADVVPEALEFAEANALLHGLRAFDTRLIDFTRARLNETFDLILAADIVYRPDDYESLATFLAAHTHPAGTILLTESLRADAHRVIDMLTAREFVDRRSATWVEEEGRKERTWLHELTRRRV